jgi:hypothetical protein
LLQGLLRRPYVHRLGSLGSGEIKDHPFFRSVDWQQTAIKQSHPPFKAYWDAAASTDSLSRTRSTDDVVVTESIREKHDSLHIYKKVQRWDRAGPVEESSGIGSSNTSYAVNTTLWSDLVPAIPVMEGLPEIAR